MTIETTQVCVSLENAVWGLLRSTHLEFDPTNDFILTAAEASDKRLKSAARVENNSHLPRSTRGC